MLQATSPRPVLYRPVAKEPSQTDKLLQTMRNPRPDREVTCAAAIQLLITRYGRSEEMARRILGLPPAKSMR